MVPGADAIADAVSDQLEALKAQTSTLVACAVARAMIRGCCRALEQTYDPAVSAISLEDWIFDCLRQEGLAAPALFRN